MSVRAPLPSFAALFFICAGPSPGRGDAVNLFPKLRAGQVIVYRIDCHSDRQTKTRSSVLTPGAAENPPTEIRVLLRMKVLAVQAQGHRAVIRARAQLEKLDVAGPAAGATPPPEASPSEGAKSLEFTIYPDGHIERIRGLEALDAQLQRAWQEWIARFAAVGLFPPRGVKLAEKWTSEQAEQSPSPIAKLGWQRQTTYVGNEPCRPFMITAHGDTVESDQAAGACAVLVTLATLRQSSPPKDTTPEDFRLHELRTRGVARGANKTVLYISLESGLLVRATDDASQAMDVTVAKADGTNSVHYEVSAKGHSEVLLIAENPPPRPQR